MKRLTFLALLALATPAFAAEEAPKELKDKASYSIGADMGGVFHNFKKQGLDLNSDMMRKGFNDALTAGALLMSEEEMRQAMQEWQKDAQGKMEQKMSADGEKNKKAGEAFLAENKKKEGVKTTASGLQYKVLTEGKGPKPKDTDTVTTNYRGTLIDGTEFDSSYKRGEPASFPVNGVIKGWTEALQLMPVGSKWQLAIPSDLAYGPQGPGEIGPNATLLFDVELLKIEDSKAGAESSPAKK